MFEAIAKRICFHLNTVSPMPASFMSKLEYNLSVALDPDVPNDTREHCANEASDALEAYGANDLYAAYNHYINSGGKETIHLMLGVASPTEEAEKEVTIIKQLHGRLAVFLAGRDVARDDLAEIERQEEEMAMAQTSATFEAAVNTLMAFDQNIAKVKAELVERIAKYTTRIAA